MKKWQILQLWLSLKRLHNFTIETEDLMTKDLAIQRSPCKAEEQRSLVSALDTKIYSRPGKCIHWNEIWTKNEPSTSFMRNIMMVYDPLKRLDAILNIQIWCHTMYLQCVKSFSQQINHRLLCHHSKACRYPTSSLLDIHGGRSPAAARKQHH